MTLAEILNKLISGLSNQEIAPLQYINHCGTKHTRN